LSEEELRLLKEKVHDHDTRIADLENILKVKKEMPTIKETAGIQKLATKLGIPVDKLDEIFDKDGSILTIIKHVGTDVKNKTQNITLLTLFGYKIYFGLEEVLSQEIRRNVAENGIPLSHFGEYLNELIPSLLRRKGKLRSPKTTYRLNIQGEAKAKELIKSIVGLL
jgi:hypothetical protein